MHARGRRLLGALVLLVAARAHAQSSVTCGPAVAGCGPGSIGGGTGTLQPSWVSAVLAAWMLDETSGTRVNLQGTTSRDLATLDTSDPASSTDRQEGARSISITAAQSRHTTDTFPGLVSPQSMGCWVKMAANPTASAAFLMHHYQDGVAGTTKLARGTSGSYTFTSYDTGAAAEVVASPSTYPNNVWTHVVGTLISSGPLLLYINGAQVASGTMTTAAASANPIYVSDNFTFSGLIDECWVVNLQLSAASVCRICSCGIRGEQCTCNGTAFATTGRNASACGACTLPADCSAAAPS